MARRKAHDEKFGTPVPGMAPRPEDVDEVYGVDTRPFIVLTPNQIVAYNLAQARTWKGWTQEQAAAELEPYLGTRWSKASVSAAERSVDGQRVRQSSADDLVAFSRCFGVPVGFFFLPPPAGAADRMIRVAAPDNQLSGIPLSELIDIVMGAPGERGYMAMRVEAFFRSTSPELLTEAQHAVQSLTEATTESVVRSSLSRLEGWRFALETLARQLEEWEGSAREQVLASANEQQPEITDE
jgi:hypothetical protein